MEYMKAPRIFTSNKHCRMFVENRRAFTGSHLNGWWNEARRVYIVSVGVLDGYGELRPLLVYSIADERWYVTSEPLSKLEQVRLESAMPHNADGEILRISEQGLRLLMQYGNAVDACKRRMAGA